MKYSGSGPGAIEARKSHPRAAQVVDCDLRGFSKTKLRGLGVYVITVKRAGMWARACLSAVPNRFRLYGVATPAASGTELTIGTTSPGVKTLLT